MEIDYAKPTITVFDKIGTSYEHIKYTFMTLCEHTADDDLVPGRCADLQGGMFATGAPLAEFKVEDAHNVKQSIYSSELTSANPVPSIPGVGISFRYMVNFNKTYTLKNYGFVTNSQSVRGTTRAEFSINNWFLDGRLGGNLRRFNKLKLHIRAELSRPMNEVLFKNITVASVEEDYKKVLESVALATPVETLFPLLPDAYIYNVTRTIRYAYVNLEVPLGVSKQTVFVYSAEPTVRRDETIMSFANTTYSVRHGPNTGNMFDIYVDIPYASESLFYSIPFSCRNIIESNDTATFAIIIVVILIILIIGIVLLAYGVSVYMKKKATYNRELARIARMNSSSQ
jgi:hypothetical protein